MDLISSDEEIHEKIKVYYDTPTESFLEKKYGIIVNTVCEERKPPNSTDHAILQNISICLNIVDKYYKYWICKNAQKTLEKLDILYQVLDSFIRIVVFKYDIEDNQLYYRVMFNSSMELFYANYFSGRTTFLPPRKNDESEIAKTLRENSKQSTREFEDLIKQHIAPQLEILLGIK